LTPVALLLGLLLSPPFDPVSAGRALVDPEARGAALRAVLNGDALTLRAARSSSLRDTVARIIADPTAAFPDRVLAIRVAALLQGEVAVEPLRGLQVGGGSPQALALAREAARALRQIHAWEALAGGLDSADPEVRALAAGGGAGPTRLCALLTQDPWAQVRAAAARGLARHPKLAGCLADALDDRHSTVVMAAVHSAGEAGVQGLRDPLRGLAGRSGTKLPIRAEAFLALGRLGDLEPARQALTTHLKTGDIAPLAEAAVRAFASQDARPALREALGSKEASVRTLAARALIALKDLESVPRLKSVLEDLPPRARRALRDELRRLEGGSDEVDPALNDPE